MIILFILIFVCINVVKTNDFNGGTIYWSPVYPNDSSTLVLITITQTYWWIYPNISCMTNMPISSGAPYISANTNLTCVANCSTQGGYASKVISILTDCISYSAPMGVSTSQRSVNITLNESSYFWIAYRQQAWRAVENAATTALLWSIVSLIDLRRRPDGFINTAPVAHVTSPQYVVVNKTTTINIDVSDANISDDIRCRWSLQNSLYGVDECADVCADASLLTLANLSGCKLTFTAIKSSVWYVIAVQVEDFINTTSLIPMSSVPLQFLVYVLPIPNCQYIPVILPLTDCLEVQVNVQVTFTLCIMNYCNRTKTVITDLIPTASIVGMQVGNLTNSTVNSSLSYVTLTWTPQMNQTGYQQFCTIAYTNEKVQSDSYCVTFTVITSQPCTFNDSSRVAIAPSARLVNTVKSRVQNVTTNTTTVTQGLVTVTVSVPISVKDSSKATALALGLSIPLGLILSALGAYACCRDQLTALGRFLCQKLCKKKPPDDSLFEPNEKPVENSIESNEKHMDKSTELNKKTDDHKNDSQIVSDGYHDYRNEYINERKEDEHDEINNESELRIEEHLSAGINSSEYDSGSEYEFHTVNVTTTTTTSMFSSSKNNLPTDTVRYINETSEYSSKENASKIKKPKPKGSILVRAYSEQEKQKPDQS